MKHTSVKLNTPCEFINITKINPLISKCQIKVCYVGDEPNRNRSVITKDVAVNLAQSLPGSPIVGYFNEETADFGEHERGLEIKDNKLVLKDMTKPYGFVDVNAKCWFQWFLDDNSVEREYLMTEGYIWTGQYPESQRIISQGNNQSMELDENIFDGFWTKDNNGKPQFFIINDAIISKLCVLGEEEEPCFEGSQITKFEFSLGEDLKQELFSMMNKIQELLGEGGKQAVFNTYAVEVGDSLWTSLYKHVGAKYSISAVLTEEDKPFAILEEGEKKYRLDFSYSEEEGFVPAEEVSEFADVENLPTEIQFALEDVEKFIADYAAAQEKEEKEDDEEKVCPKCGKPVSECTCEDEEEDKDEKKTYSLEEYQALEARCSELQSNLDSVQTQFNALSEQFNTLNEFKLSVERKDKEAMIAKFFMLSDEDKKDVVENIDTYSLEDIESKLSVICFRNKISFNTEEEKEEGKDTLTYSLKESFDDNTMPAWVKAVKETQNSL